MKGNSIRKITIYSVSGRHHGSTGRPGTLCKGTNNWEAEITVHSVPGRPGGSPDRLSTLQAF